VETISVIEVSKKSLWLPDYIVENIAALDRNQLHNRGITHIVFDIDKTLVERKVSILTPEYLLFLQTLQNNGFILMLGSNSRRNISGISESLHVHAVQPKGLSYKPTKSFYRRIVAEAQTAPNHIAMVGDHIINDVYGPNRAGFMTILVSASHLSGPLKRGYMHNIRKYFSGA
jgi:HAD superfamily phosphatase (TIGR01668 family)